MSVHEEDEERSCLTRPTLMTTKRTGRGREGAWAWAFGDGRAVLMTSNAGSVKRSTGEKTALCTFGEQCRQTQDGVCVLASPALLICTRDGGVRAAGAAALGEGAGVGPDDDGGAVVRGGVMGGERAGEIRLGREVDCPASLHSGGRICVGVLEDGAGTGGESVRHRGRDAEWTGRRAVLRRGLI